MSNIDNRVVRMDFENKAFESNAKESMKTISDLKKSLDFNGSAQSLKDLEEKTRSFRLGGLSGAVDEVSNRFSAMEIIGITALANITNSAVNAGKALIKSVSTDQITAGWTKYADKTTAVQTIMAATASQFADQATQMAAVNDQLEKLSWFTDETSYNFVDMVSNIGKFTSNQIALDDAVTSMQGIATWAAISGANTNDASRAMYNLSQAIGTGAVTVLDWRSIENANMATAEFKQTAIDTAVAMGKLTKVGDGLYKTMSGTEVSVSNFREGLKDKWFTNDVLTSTLDRYGAFTTKLNSAFNETGKLTSELLDDIERFKNGVSAADLVGDASVSAERYAQILAELSDETMDFGRKAFAAAQETKTFSEVIDYTKDAVSSQWMAIFEAIFGGYLEAKALWTQMSEDFYTLFVEPLEGFRGVIEDAFGSKWGQLSDSITNAGLSMEEFETHVKNAMDPKLFDDVIAKYGSLEKAAQAGALSENSLSNALNSMIDSALGNVDATEQVTSAYVNLEDIVKRVIGGEFGNGEARYKALADAGYDYATVQDLVNRTLAGEVVNYEVLSEAQENFSNLTDEQKKKLLELKESANGANGEVAKLLEEVEKPTGRQLFAESIQNAFAALIKTIAIIKDAWNDIFPATTSERIYHLITILHDFTENVLTHLDNNAEKIKATLRGVFSILDMITSIIKGAFKMALKVVGGLVGALGINIWDVTAAIGNWIYKIRNLTTANDKLHNGLKNFASGVINRFKELGKSIKELDSIKALRANFDKLINTIKSIGTSVLDWIVERFRSIGNISLDVPISGTQILTKIIDTLAKVVNGVFKAFSKGKESVIGFFGSLKGKDIGISDALTSIGDSAKDMYKSIGDSAIGSIGEYLSAGFTKLGEAIKDRIKNFDFKSLFSLAKQGLRLYFLYQLADLTKTIKQGIKQPLTSVQELTAAFKGVLGNLAKTISDYGNNLKADSILKIAGAIGILAASVAILSFIPHDQLADATAVIVILAGVLALIMKVFTNFANAKADTSLIDISNAMESIKISIVGFLKSLAGTAKIVAMGIAVSSMLIALATAVTLLLGAVFAISKIIQNDSESAAAAILSVMGLILALGAAIKMMSNVNAGGLIGGASAIMAVALSVTIIVGAVKQMQDAISGKNFGTAIASVIGIMIAIGSMIRMTDDFGTVGNGATFLGFALAIRIITGGIAALAELDSGSVLLATASVGSIITLLMMLAGASNAADASKLAGMAKSMIVIAGAIAVFVVAITQLGEHAEEAWQGFILLAASITAFVIAAAAVQYLGLGPALIELSIAMAAFGVSALAIGGAFALVGVGIDLITKGFARLGPAMKSFVKGWVEAAKNVIDNADTLKEGTSKVIDIMISAVTENIGKLGELGLALIKALAGAIISGAPAIAVAGVYVIVMLLEVIAAMIMPVAFAIADVIVATLNAVAEVIKAYGPAILAALANIVGAIIQMLLDVIASMIENIPGVGEKVAKAIRGLGDDIDSVTQKLVDDAAKTTDKAKKKLKDSFDFKDVIENNDLLDTVGGALKDVFDFSDTGGLSGLMDQFGVTLPGAIDKTSESADKASKSIDNLSSTLSKNNLEKSASVLKKSLSGLDFSEYYKDDPSGEYVGANAAIDAMDTVFSDTSEMQANAANAGNVTVMSYVGTILKNSWRASSAGSSVGDSATASMDKSKSSWFAGIWTAEGFINGILSKKKDADKAGDTISSSFVNKVSRWLDIGSPSKVMMEIGGFTAMGFIIGILNKQKDAVSAADDFASASSDTMKATLARAMQAISDEEYTPTIRPVLDLRNLDNGMTDISAMFNSTRTAAIGANVRIGASDESRYNDFSSIMEKRDRDLQREFSNLRGSVNELIAKLDDLELRMDGDDVVAGLSGKFDRAIGRSAAMKQRGM